MELIIFIVILTAAFFIFAISLGIKAQRRKPTTGIEGLVGKIGKAVTNLSPAGEISIHGEFWNAESLDGEIGTGEEVKIVEVEDLKLKVKKITD